MKRHLAMVGFALVALVAFADAPMVSNVKARQRYPWNGLVDITCQVSGIEGTTNGLYFSVSSVNQDSEIANRISHFWVVKDGVNSPDREVHTNGNYRLLWNAQVDVGEGVYSNMVVGVTLEGHDKVQLWEGGPYWATTNIGADNPWDCGYYFWWGDTVGYKRVGNAWVASDGSSSNFSFDSVNAPTYNKSVDALKSEGWITADGVLASEHDAAQVKWGGEWRMPTKDELSALTNNCDWIWTTTNSVDGYIVRGKGEYASASIFLPVDGFVYSTIHYDADSLGYYWSSVPLSGSDCFSGNLYFSLSDRKTPNDHRDHGMAVRPVQGFSRTQMTRVTIEGDSAPFLIDTRMGPRNSTGNETLAYSSVWDGGEGATVTIAQDGVAIAEGLTGEDAFVWSVTRNGTYVLTHTIYTNGVAGAVETATFVVTGKDVPFIPGEGTVTPPKSWKTGQKVTWKAAAAKGSVFARWSGEFVESLGLSRNELRNPAFTFVVPPDFDESQISALFVSIDEDGLRELSFRDGNGQKMGDEDGILLKFGEPVEFWLVDDSKSYVNASVSGLPSGLKFDAKTMKVTGTPAKRSANWVQVKAKNASGYQWAEKVRMAVSGYTAEPNEPKLTRTAYHPLTVISSDATAGTVSGTGVYAEGKKASISAKPAKGRVFAGWYRDAGLAEPMEFSSGDYRKPSQSVVVPEVRYLYARFVAATSADDPVTGLAAKGSGLVGENAFAWRVGVAVPDGDGVEYESASLPTASAAKLPPGVKFDAAKGCFTGVPTKAGSYQAAVTVKNASKETATVSLAIEVAALDEWAQGAFNGAVEKAERNGEEVAGLVTLTVDAKGKIGGKILEGGKTWTVSAPSFSGVGSDFGGLTYYATVIAKSGKEIATNEIAIVAEETGVLGARPYRGFAAGTFEFSNARTLELSAWQDLWKIEPWKTMAKPFAKAPAVTTPDNVALKFAASGSVTAKCLSYSCTSALIPVDGHYVLYLYFPPKDGKFDGYTAEVPLEWDGKEFSLRGMCVDCDE